MAHTAGAQPRNSDAHVRTSWDSGEDNNHNTKKETGESGGYKYEEK